jgi:ribonuclease G
VIEGMLNRRVDLPSGGYLMIDYAEALTVIDVNSGSFIGRGKGARLEDTITKTNLEAAEEVVNQLRLRDIGGIIVIDFIDMARARNRDAVLKTLRKALEEDRTKTFTAEISKLGLVEMTRQNVTEGVREIMTRHCPTCEGEGVIRSEETIAIEFERRLREVAAQNPASEAFLVQIHPRVTAQFTGQGSRVLHALEEQTGRFFHFEGSEGLTLDHFAITAQGTRAEVEELALPFRDGDEVLVQIVEPHMYNVDDAVAKIDGYIISITGAARLVGEKHLVRIEEVGRTAAVASLLDAEPATGAGKVTKAEPAPRRRTRRRKAEPEPEAEAETEAPAEADAEDGAHDVRGSEGLDDPAEALSASDAAATMEGDGSAEEGGLSASRGEPEQDEDEDGLQSRPRRRGRRGGRRRSTAGARSSED